MWAICKHCVQIFVFRLGPFAIISCVMLPPFRYGIINVRCVLCVVRFVYFCSLVCIFMFVYIVCLSVLP